MNAVDGVASAGSASLSVVVPFYDVEAYLGECLESVAAQTHRDLEVICIDDGSTDGGAAVAREFAEEDPRFRVVRQRNAGPGAARNAGVRLATGRYLAFLDGDDLLHPDAYAPMVRSLESSGSDFATGRIERLTSVGLRPSPTFAPIVAIPRTATHVTRDHVLLVDRLATQKVWRRSFWLEHRLAFPEGVLYEDINVAIPAHFLARSVDVLNTPMYQWRIREGADRSITQRRLELRNMRDRVSAVTTASAFIASGGWDAEKREYDRLVFTGDLRYFAVLLDQADATFAADFVDRAGAFVRQAHADSLAALPAVERLRWHLIGLGDTAGAVALAQHLRRPEDERPARRRRRRIELDVPVLEGRRLPRHLLDLRDEVSLVTQVSHVELDADHLRLEGRVWLRHLDAPDPARQRLTMWLVREGTRIRGEVQTRAEPSATAAGRPDVHDLRGAGFRAVFPLEAVIDGYASGTERWHVEARLRSGRTTRRGPVTGPVAGRPRRPQPVDVGPLRIVPRADGEGVGLTVTRPGVVVTACSSDGDVLALELHSRHALDALLVRSSGRERRIPVAEADARHYRARIRPEDVAPDLARCPVGSETVWALHGLTSTGSTPRAVASATLDQRAVGDHRGELSLDITRYGNVSFGVRPGALWLEDAEVDGDTVRIRGSVVGRDHDALRVELTPRGYRGDRRLPTRALHDGRVTVELPLDGWPSPLGSQTPPAGTYELQAAEVHPDGRRTAVEVHIRRSLIARLPLVGTSRGRPASVDDLSWQRPALIVEDDLDPDERGRFHRRRAWAAAAATRQIDPCLVVLLAVDGRSSGGDVGAIADELLRTRTDLRLVGAVADGQTVWPTGVDPVRLGGSSWFRALADAGTVITDSPLPSGFTRAEGQRVVRTWDGPPVGALGLLDPAVASGHERYREAVRRDAAAWTHLLAADASAAAVLRRAYEPSGDIVVARPALDRVASVGDLQALGAELRRRLGLDPATRVVLWASTWSPDERHPGGAYRATPDLDLARLRDALPPGVVVLSRSHPRVADRLHDRDVSPRLLDVSSHRWLIDLLVLADVVVTPPTSVVADARAVDTPVVVVDPGWARAGTEVRTGGVDPVAADSVAREPDELVRAVVAALDVRGSSRTSRDAPGALRASTVDGAARVVTELFPS